MGLKPVTGFEEGAISHQPSAISQRAGVCKAEKLWNGRKKLKRRKEERDLLFAFFEFLAAQLVHQMLRPQRRPVSRSFHSERCRSGGT